MKLSEQTITILKNFASINQSIKFVAGNEIRTVSPQNHIVGKATISDLIPQDFAIYDLSRFLQCANLIGEPTLEFSDNYVNIVGDSNQIRYAFTDPTLITGANYEKQYQITKEIANVTITQSKLQKIKQAASVLGSTNISLVGSDGDINLIAHDLKNKSADRYKVFLGNTDNKFTVVYGVDDFKMILDNYTLAVSDKTITQFTGGLVTYTVGAEITLD